MHWFDVLQGGSRVKGCKQSVLPVCSTRGFSWPVEAANVLYAVAMQQPTSTRCTYLPSS